MPVALGVARRQVYGVPVIGGGGGGGGGFTRVTGGVLNPVLANSNTTGVGGTYPTGVIGLAAGTWIWNPITNMSLYTRGFDASKPRNNWLTVVEADGPGTVTINMAADSAGSFGAAGGGGFWITGSGGSLRWCFDGPMNWVNGAIRFDASTPVDRIIWHNTNHSFSQAEWSRQVAGSPGNLKGNDEPTAFRFHRNTSHAYILRVLIDECGDDAVFLGGGSSFIDVIGCAMSHIRNNGVGGFHNDCYQPTGGDNYRLLDSTLLSASFQLVAEGGSGVPTTNMTVDRCFQALSNSATLGAIGLNGQTMGPTNQIAQGAPTTRLSGHYIKSCANGVNDHSIGAQFVITSGAVTNHCSIIDYGGTGCVINTGNTSIFIPTGVAGGLDGNGLPTNVDATTAAILAANDVPHNLYRAAYSASDLVAEMTDYSIPLFN